MRALRREPALSEFTAMDESNPNGPSEGKRTESEKPPAKPRRRAPAGAASVKTAGTPTAKMADAIDAQNLALGKLRAGSVERTARLIAGLDLSHLEPVAARTAAALDAIIARTSVRSSELRDRAVSLPREPIHLPPGPEARTAAALQKHLPLLVTISTDTNEQIGELAAIAKAGLQESQLLRATMMHYVDEAGRAGRRLHRLTVAIVVLTTAIVVLTAVLAYLGIADPLSLPPFNAAGR
jgi:hypothetical protein